MKRSVKHLQNIDVNDEYGTPLNVFHEGCREFDVLPYMDVAASDKLHVLPHYYTIADDALTKPWSIDFWCNPPYSRVRDFLEHGVRQVRKYGVSGLYLTYAKVDTRWFHEIVMPNCSYSFIKGRIKFLRPDGTVAGPAPYPSVYIYMNPDTLEAFKK